MTRSWPSDSGVSPDGKRNRFDENFQVLRAALTGKPVQFQGRHNDIPGIALNVTPLQRPPSISRFSVGRPPITRGDRATTSSRCLLVPVSVRRNQGTRVRKLPPVAASTW